jgi:hypothetical protein
MRKLWLLAAGMAVVVVLLLVFLVVPSMLGARASVADPQQGPKGTAQERLNTELRKPTPPAPPRPDPFTTIDKKLPPCRPGPVGDKRGVGVNCKGGF